MIGVEFKIIIKPEFQTKEMKKINGHIGSVICSYDVPVEGLRTNTRFQIEVQQKMADLINQVVKIEPVLLAKEK